MNLKGLTFPIQIKTFIIISTLLLVEESIAQDSRLLEHFLDLSIAYNSAYQMLVENPQTRKDMERISSNLKSIALQQKEIQSRIEDVGLIVSEELRRAFQEEDLEELKALAHTYFRLKSVESIALTQLDNAASRSNRLSSKLVHYNDYYIAGAVINAFALQLAFSLERNPNSREVKEIVRQQSRFFNKWTDVNSSSNTFAIFDKDSKEGFFTVRHSTLLGSGKEELTRGAHIHSINGEKAKGISFKKFLNSYKSSKSKLALEIEHPVSKLRTTVSMEPYKTSNDYPLDNEISHLYEKLINNQLYIDKAFGHEFNIVDSVKSNDKNPSGRKEIEVIRYFFTLSHILDRTQPVIKRWRRKVFSCTAGSCQEFTRTHNRYYKWHDNYHFILPRIGDEFGVNSGCLISDVAYREERNLSNRISDLKNKAESCLQNHYFEVLRENEELVAQLSTLLSIKKLIILSGQIVGIR